MTTTTTVRPMFHLASLQDEEDGGKKRRNQCQVIPLLTTHFPEGSHSSRVQMLDGILDTIKVPFNSGVLSHVSLLFTNS